jgi:hypothetical protein
MFSYLRRFREFTYFLIFDYAAKESDTESLGSQECEEFNLKRFKDPVQLEDPVQLHGLITHDSSVRTVLDLPCISDIKID